MDDLRPDVDEVRRFQQERAKSAKVKTTPATDAESKPSQAQRTPNVTKKMEVSGGDVAKAQYTATPAKKNYFNLLLALMIICLAVGAAYYGRQQQLLIEQMDENLAYATDYMKQSKLLMARLEGRVHETGSELEQSGSAVDQKLQFLDSEMRKLWGVAGDTNKKLIAQTQSEIDSIKTVTTGLTDAVISQERKSQVQQNSIDELQTSLTAKAKEIVSLQASLAKQSADNTQLVKTLEQLKTQIKTLETAQAKLATDLLVQVQEAKSEIASVNEAVKSSADAESPFEKRIKNTEASIESINATRRQVNERIVTIERRLNDIQLLLKSSQPIGIAP